MYLIILLRLLNALLSASHIYWIFLALIWFDYRQWTSMNLAAQMLAVADASQVNLNETAFNETDLDENLSLFNVSTSSNHLFETIDVLLEQLNYDDVNDTESSTISMQMMSDEIPLLNFTSFGQHLFIHTAYAYRLPVLQIVEFLFIVFVIKIGAGVPMMCLAEKFQIYRNRILFKITLCIGILNFIFFCGTLICYRIDDSSLIFTYYMAKLLNLVYGSFLLITFPIDTIGLNEMAETFSLTKRYGCLAFITIFEQLFHILVILILMNAQFQFYFHLVESMLVCIICYLLLNKMPNECLNCTLRTARDKYFVKMASTNT